MATALDLQEHINKLDVVLEATKAIDRTADEMAVLNREQLENGHDRQGHKLKPSYRSKVYAEEKNRMNPGPGMWNPDLILTGAFVESFTAKLSGQSIDFEATESKADDLIEKYGKDVLGLEDTQQEYYNYEVFYPEFAGEIENKTGLKFK